MIIISIDIGEKNLGWTLAKFTNSDKISISDISFTSGVYDYKKHGKKELVLSRALSLKTFFEEHIDRKEEVFGAVVERQVNRNEIAMEIMYSVVTFLISYTENIVIFDPKKKFLTIGQQYSSANKAHKRQSIANMYKMLDSNKSDSFRSLKETLDSANKKDDIADSFNQLIIQLLLWNKLTETLTDIKEIYNQGEIKIVSKSRGEKTSKTRETKFIELELDENVEISTD